MTSRATETGIIASWNESLEEPVSLTLLSTADERSARLESFCDLLAGAAPKVRIVRRKTEEPELPAFLVGPWRYHGVPEGLELEPFLEMLAGAPPLDRMVRERIEAVAPDRELSLFIAPQCTFCPWAVRRMIPVVSALSRCRAVLIDTVLFPEIAQERQVKAVPTLIVDAAHRLTGDFRISELVEILEKSDVSGFSTDALKRMLKEGRAELLAKMMLEKGEVFAGFLPLLTHAEWSTRLGAIVVLEEMARFDRELTRKVLEHLWEEYPNLDASVRGDIVYLIGEIGEAGWAPVLELMAGREESEELREALTEALTKLKQ